MVLVPLVVSGTPWVLELCVALGAFIKIQGSKSDAHSLLLFFLFH